MYKTILDIILMCNFLTAGFDSGITIKLRFTDPSGSKNSWESGSRITKKEMHDNCMKLGTRAVSNGIEDIAVVLVTAFEESKFATNAIGIGKTKSGKPATYYGILQIAPFYTCPDTLKLPHYSWKSKSLHYTFKEKTFVCDAEQAGLIFIKNLENKYKGEETLANRFCEFKAGRPCSHGVEDRTNLYKDLIPHLENKADSPCSYGVEYHTPLYETLIPHLANKANPDACLAAKRNKQKDLQKISKNKQRDLQKISKNLDKTVIDIKKIKK